jgi:hypothetical protein
MGLFPLISGNQMKSYVQCLLMKLLAPIFADFLAEGYNCKSQLVTSKRWTLTFNLEEQKDSCADVSEL